MFQPRPLEMVKSDTCLSDADKNFHEIEMTGGKVVGGGGGRGGILDTHDSTIHSGHFMVSHVHDEAETDSDSDDALPPLPIVKSPDATVVTKFGYDFNKAEQETAETYNFHPPVTMDISSTSKLDEPYDLTGEDDSKPREVAIDASLSRLFECMTLAYSKLTSPRWKTFKGMKVNVKDKIRLNNIIWREWHMQYIKKHVPFICQFAAPLSEDVHSKPEAIVLEGKYWKRRLDTVTTEYQKWRSYYRQRLKNRPDDQMDIEMTNAQLLDRLATQDPRRIPVQRSPTPAMMEEDFLMDLAADNFFASLSSQSFMFPVSKDIGPLGNADFIQPGLFPLQPNFEDIMETMDSDMLSGSLMSGASFVKSEPNLAAANMDFSTSPTEKRGESASSLATIDLTQIMPQSSSTPPTPSSNGTLLTPTSFLASRPSFPITNQQTNSFFTIPSSSSLSSNSGGGQGSLPVRTSSSESSRTVRTMQSLISTSQQSSRSWGSKPMDTLPRSGLLPHVPQLHGQTNLGTRNSGLQNQSVENQRSAQIQATQSGIQTQNLQTRLLPAQHQPMQVTQIPKPVQLQHVQQFQTQGFAGTLNTVQLSGGDTLYAVGNPPVLVQQSQLSGLLPQQKQHVNLVGTMNSSIHAVKLEPDLVLPWSNVQVQQVQAGNQVIIPVHESSTVQQTPMNQSTMNAHPVVTTAASILVQQLLSKSTYSTAIDSNFVVPKTQTKGGKRPTKKPRNIAPAVTSPVTVVSPSSPSPSTQSTYLAQLLRRGTHPGAMTAGIKPAVDIALQNPPNVEVNEFQKSLVMAAANKAAFGSIPFQSDNQPLASTSFSLGQSLGTSSFLSQSASNSVFTSQSTTSSGFSILCPPSGMSGDPVDLCDSPPTSDISASNSESNLMSRFQPRYEEKEKYKEHRRVCHISAEQKRRSSIKNGFDTLHVLIPAIAKTQNPKISKAAMLQKTADYLRKLKEDRAAMQAEEEMLRRNVDTLNVEINECQSQLPATGAPFNRQREDQLKGAFDDYVRARTMQNWKFWIFSTIFQDLFTSFNSMVSTASVDELCRTILAWLDQHCSLIALRPVALNSLCSLSKTTSILSDPSRVPQQAAEAVRRRDSDPGSNHRR